MFESNLLKVKRLAKHKEKYPDIKDPSIIHMPDGSWRMYASIGNSLTEKWRIGCFKADHPESLWQETEPAVVKGVKGHQICAPSMIVEDNAIKMYVQSGCFSCGTYIVEGYSADGIHFEMQPTPAMSKEYITSPFPLIGLYDVSTRTNISGKWDCMTFSAYRDMGPQLEFTGSGDVYRSIRPADNRQQGWSTPKLIIQQENIPYHNQPGTPNFEWGLEAADILELKDNDESFFLTPVVGFLNKGSMRRDEYFGTRQRVFLAASRDITDPCVPIAIPFTPVSALGENGHPDVIDMGEEITFIYQERQHAKDPWHLRYSNVPRQSLVSLVRNGLKNACPAPLLQAA